MSASTGPRRSASTCACTRTPPRRRPTHRRRRCRRRLGSIEAGTMSSASPLNETIQFLKGVGSARAELLGKLDVRTVGDLLLHFPRSYDDLSDVRRVDQLEAGELRAVSGEIFEMGGKELPVVRAIP